jgi:hypothetical protein
MANQKQKGQRGRIKSRFKIASDPDKWYTLGDTSKLKNLVEINGLEILDLSGNQLVVLPEAITQLTSLVGLYLNDNQLTMLPDAPTRAITSGCVRRIMRSCSRRQIDWRKLNR